MTNVAREAREAADVSRALAASLLVSAALLWWLGGPAPADARVT